MGKPSKQIKDVDRARFAEFQRIGCIPCNMDGRRLVPPDSHHHKDGNARLGHQVSTAECPWHHRGCTAGFNDAEQAKRFLGPSRALHPEEFRAKYGPDEHLLELQERLLGYSRSMIVGGLKPRCKPLPRIA
jgi:hypothetical protein